MTTRPTDAAAQQAKSESGWTIEDSAERTVERCRAASDRVATDLIGKTDRVLEKAERHLLERVE